MLHRRNENQVDLKLILLSQVGLSFQANFKFSCEQKNFSFRGEMTFEACVIDIPGVPLAIKTIKISFKVTQLDLNAMNQCQYLPQRNHNCSNCGRNKHIV